ncbi:hypothetical protein DMN91_000860 [Ooceraea biroi]|uniref:Uncharacterized protein n=1 Tax=Ooceraea biroi TaxID=2015173 RepID=A0A3L8E2U7_OOCBI|nr:hypothetical protein DMN91_000860 [Ooceraea biroi]
MTSEHVAFVMIKGEIASGQFVVEDVEDEDYELRRLVFLDNPYVIQSEARLKEGWFYNVDWLGNVDPALPSYGWRSLSLASNANYSSPG